MFTPHNIFEQLHLQSEMNVLDLGCGSQGFFTFPSSEKVGHTGKVFSADIRLSALEELMRRSKLQGYVNILPIHIDLEKKRSLVPFVFDEQVDRAMCINTISELNQIGPLFEEVARVLKPEGRFLVVDWKLNQPRFTQNRRTWSAPVISTFAKHAGLIPLKRFEVSNYHFGMMFTRPE